MPLRTDLLSPIPGENPSGVNLRYDPVTDKIKEARREDLDVPQGEWKTSVKTADWNQVIKVGSDALAKRARTCKSRYGWSMLISGKRDFHFLNPVLNSFTIF